MIEHAKQKYEKYSRDKEEILRCMQKFAGKVNEAAMDGSKETVASGETE